MKLVMFLGCADIYGSRQLQDYMQTLIGGEGGFGLFPHT